MEVKTVNDVPEYGFNRDFKPGAMPDEVMKLTESFNPIETD